MISGTEYCVLLKSYKRLRNSCRNSYDRNENLRYIYDKVEHIDIFVDCTETDAFINNKNFVYKINYNNNSKNIYIEKNDRDY